MKALLLVAPTLLLLLCAAALSAQPPATPDATGSDQSAEIAAIRGEIARLSARLDTLEANTHHVVPRGGLTSEHAEPASDSSSAAVTAAASPDPAAPTQATTPTLTAADSPMLALFRGTTLNFGVDGYYGYNFNQPIGRVNLLRAYDVTSNSFNINQASVVVEHLPTTEDRIGGRVDLQFGQATETLQGSGVNEQRPQVWRNLYQAYGSYLAPLGHGLQLDFGKFSSSLGNEGNYTKDQIAYSRSYSFNYLPFYHMGLRATYAVTPRLNAVYWLVNGANDTEDLNGFKSQAFLLAVKPASSLTWNINYYFGQEARDVQPTLNPGLPTSPTQPGLPSTNLSPAPNGREHIFDTYATWTPTKNTTVVGEADYVLNRTLSEQQPARVVIGGLTAKYALPRNWTIGARAEYFDDRGGLFSGRTQALKEVTVIGDHVLAPGFLARAEYRRDFSNQRFFLTDTPDVLSHSQSTATLGLVYWWGMKQGAW